MPMNQCMKPIIYTRILNVIVGSTLAALLRKGMSEQTTMAQDLLCVHPIGIMHNCDNSLLPQGIHTPGISFQL